MASIMLNTEITPYEVTMIHVATKMARLQESRSLDDNYVDAMNYLSFAAQFAPVHETPKVIQPTYNPQPLTTGMVEDDIAEIAKRFAPVKQEDKSE